MRSLLVTTILSFALLSAHVPTPSGTPAGESAQHCDALTQHVRVAHQRGQGESYLRDGIKPTELPGLIQLLEPSHALRYDVLLRQANLCRKTTSPFSSLF